MGPAQRSPIRSLTADIFKWLVTFFFSISPILYRVDPNPPLLLPIQSKELSRLFLKPVRETGQGWKVKVGWDGSDLGAEGCITFMVLVSRGVRKCHCSPATREIILQIERTEREAQHCLCEAACQWLIFRPALTLTTRTYISLSNRNHAKKHGFELQQVCLPLSKFSS